MNWSREGQCQAHFPSLNAPWLGWLKSRTYWPTGKRRKTKTTSEGFRTSCRWPANRGVGQFPLPTGCLESQDTGRRPLSKTLPSPDEESKAHGGEEANLRAHESWRIIWVLGKVVLAGRHPALAINGHSQDWTSIALSKTGLVAYCRKYTEFRIWGHETDSFFPPLSRRLTAPLSFFVFRNWGALEWPIVQPRTLGFSSELWDPALHWAPGSAHGLCFRFSSPLGPLCVAVG